MAGTTWPSLVAGTKAKASDVENKFDWIEGSIVPMNAGDKTNAAYDLGESSYRWKDLYMTGIFKIPSGDVTPGTPLTNTVTQPKVKTTTGSASGYLGLSNSAQYVNITMNDYCFFPHIEGKNREIELACVLVNSYTSSYVGHFRLFNTTNYSDAAYQVLWRYVSAS